MTKRFNVKTIAITLAALGTAIAPAAFAAPSDDVSVTIDTRYLETDWGVEKVYNILSSKAESACVSGSSRSISARKFENDCTSDLLDDFIQDLDDEKLTSYHSNMIS